ncbi:MAG: hypothetical protein QOG04_21 [Actinomycetota bacterium]|jgi:hypothetical protein|nr:hypothetical protein [Actinomycetota bacterium]
MLVAAQLAACLVVAWACGVVALERLDRRVEAAGGERFGSAERALISALAFLGLCVVLMVGHIVTGGVIFGVPGVVPAIAVALVVVAWRKRAPRWPHLERKHLSLALLAIALIAIYAVPVFLSGSGVRAGDPPWHLGWTEQLLHGDPVPTGPAPEFGANAYPWGFHSILATMVRLVPGSDPLIAHETMHLLLIALIPLAAACLARLVNPKAGFAAAWLAGLAGGFGWVHSGLRAFDATPTEARFGADLVVASPNSVYELFPPALPREVALIALGAATLMLAVALRSGDRRLQLVGGAAMGAVGLISVPMLLTAVAWSVAMCLITVKKDRIRASAAVLGGAVVVFALWAGPVLRDYIRYDGFVNITPQLGVEWDLGTALASWGILLPLAIAGIGILLAQPRVVSRPLLACLGGSLLLFGLSIARAKLDWGVFGNETLLHQGRMWPPLHLLGAACAGVAAVVAYGWLRARARALAVSLGAVVALLGIASPVVAAGGLTHLLDTHTKGFDYAEPDLVSGSFMRRAASHLSPDDVVRVDGSDELAFLLFQFSGVKLANYDDPRLIGNELRIRYSDLAAQWDRQDLDEGFEPDYVVRPVAGPIITLEIEQGRFDDEFWELVPADG